MHTAEPLVPEPISLEDKTAIEKLKKYLSNSGRTDPNRSLYIMF
jgi:hypothetical protein